MTYCIQHSDFKLQRCLRTWNTIFSLLDWKVHCMCTPVMCIYLIIIEDILVAYTCWILSIALLWICVSRYSSRLLLLFFGLSAQNHVWPEKTKYSFNILEHHDTIVPSHHISLCSYQQHTAVLIYAKFLTTLLLLVKEGI